MQPLSSPLFVLQFWICNFHAHIVRVDVHDVRALTKQNLQKMTITIRPSIHSWNPFYPGQGRRGLEPIPVVTGWEAGFSLDKLRVHHRDKRYRQTNAFMLIITPLDNIDSSLMNLHVGTMEANYTERPQIWTHDLVALRQNAQDQGTECHDNFQESITAKRWHVQTHRGTSDTSEINSRLFAHIRLRVRKWVKIWPSTYSVCLALKCEGRSFKNRMLHQIQHLFQMQLIVT